jgi:hypothetical protein
MNIIFLPTLLFELPLGANLDSRKTGRYSNDLIKNNLYQGATAPFADFLKILRAEI